MTLRIQEISRFLPSFPDPEPLGKAIPFYSLIIFRSFQGPEGYERRSPSEKSRQELSESAILNSEKDLGYGRIPPRRPDPPSARSRPAAGEDVDLQLMQKSIEQLRRQIQEKEAAARNVRTASYIERSLPR